jgi:lysophospholipase L1-like esterase
VKYDSKNLAAKVCAWAIASACAVSVYGVAPDYAQLAERLAKSDNTAVQPSPRIPVNEPWLAAHAKRQQVLDAGKFDVLLVGDSITAGWSKHPELLKKVFGERPVMNLGHPADKTQNIIWRLLNHKLDHISPKLAIVMAGTNNSNEDEWTEEQIAEGVQAIVRVLRAKLPETSVLLLGIFPRGSREQRIEIKSGLTDAGMNPQWEKIDRVNRIIQTFADGTNVVYLNINQALLNEKGALPVTVMPDLLHPNEKGYELWGNAMTPTLEKMIGSAQ